MRIRFKLIHLISLVVLFSSCQDRPGAITAVPATIPLTTVPATNLPTATATQAIAKATNTPTALPTVTPTTMPTATSTPTISLTAEISVDPTTLPFISEVIEPAVPDFMELDAFRAAMRPGNADDVALMAYFTQYRVGATVDLTQGTIAGHEIIHFINPEEVALEDILLRLYPNLTYMELMPTSADNMRVSTVLVNGEAVEARYTAENTAVLIPLAQPLLAGAEAQIELSFTSRFSSEPDEYGLWRLYPFYPLVAVYDESGWRQDFATAGDVAYNESANHVLSLTATSDLTLVSSGTVISETMNDDNTTTYTVLGPGMRQMVAAFSDFSLRQEVVDGITIDLWSQANYPFIEERIATAVAVTAIYNEYFGFYPYNELDIIGLYNPQIGSDGGGLEYPGYVYATYGQTPGTFGIAHEIAHQWWYGVVGNDTHLEPWLDEPMASISALLYFRETEGDEAVQRFLRRYLSLLELEETGSDLPVGRPVYGYRDPFLYIKAVYGNGVIFLEELRTTMGDDAFFAFLQAYYDMFKYDVASGEDFQVLAEAMSGQDLSTLFDEWLD